MAGSDKQVQYEITADAAGFVAAMELSAGSVQKASAQIDAQFKKISESAGAFIKVVTGLTAVLAGGGAFKEFINDANNWNVTAGKMAKQLGITTEQASILNVALDHIGVEADTFTTAAQKMSKQISTNANAFKVLGVETMTADGQYRQVTEVMQEVNEKLAAIKNPIEQNIAGQQVYGKGWAEVRGILKLTTEVMDEATDTARQLGLIVGPEGAAMSKKYAEQMRDLNLVGEAMKVQFGDQLLPIFLNIGKEMKSSLPAAASVMGEAFKTTFQAVVVLGANVKFVFESVGREFGAIAAQIAILGNPKRWGSGQWTAISQAVKEDGERARAELIAFEKKILGDAAKVPDKDFGKGRKDHEGDAAAPHYDFGKPKADSTATTGPEKTDMPGFEAALANWQAAYAQLHQGRELDKQDVLAYWEAVLQSTTLSAADRVKIEKMVSTQKIDILKQERKERDDIDAINAKSDEDLALGRVDAQKVAADALVANDRMTAAQRAQLEVQFEDQRYQIQSAALQARLDLLSQDPTLNVVQLAQLHAQMLLEEQQYQTKRAQLQTQAQVAINTEQTQAFAQFKSGFASLIQTLMQGTFSWRNAVKGVFDTIAQNFAQVASNIVTNWLKSQIEIQAASKQTTLAQIYENAKAAGAAAYNAVVGIPVVGPFLAPVAAAAAFAGTVAFASAEGGYDIPNGVNPITQLHAEEMVLPKAEANVVRSLADGGAGAAGGGAGGDTYQTTILALDGASVHRVLMANPAAVAAAIKNATRNGHLR